MTREIKYFEGGKAVMVSEEKLQKKRWLRLNPVIFQAKQLKLSSFFTNSTATRHTALSPWPLSTKNTDVILTNTNINSFMFMKH
jgi:3-phenylpropionate/cinnamic acid dioxygenase small subunit